MQSRAATRGLVATVPAAAAQSALAALAATCPAGNLLERKLPLGAPLALAVMTDAHLAPRRTTGPLPARGGAAAGRGFDRLLALAGVVAALTYFNFGAFHFGNYVHAWDTFHDYVGARYFRELGCDRLYECVAVADALEAELAARVARRRITYLRTNVLESSREILAHPKCCTERFSAAR